MAKELSRPARIGIVGAGNISRLHLEGLAEHAERAICVALCDPNIENLNKTGDEFGIEARFTSLPEFIASGMDAVILCTPTALRLEALEPLMQAGLPILCEKPLAETYSEAKAIADAADKYGVPVAVNQNFRRHFTFAMGRDLLAKNDFGKPLHIVQKAMGLRQDAGWRLDRKRYAMSVMFIHWFDGYRFLLDDEPISIYVKGVNSPATPGGEDIAVSIIMEFAKGTIVCLSESFSSFTGNWDGALFCDCERGGLIMGYKQIETVDAQRQKQSFDNPHNKAQATYVVLDDLLNAVQEGRQPETAVQDNVNSLRIMEAAYRSFEEGCVVKIEEIK